MWLQQFSWAMARANSSYLRLTPSVNSTLLSVTAALCGQSPLELSDSVCHAAEDVPAEAAHGHSKRKALKNFLHKLRHGAESDTIPSAPSRQGEHTHRHTTAASHYCTNKAFKKRIFCTKDAWKSCMCRRHSAHNRVRSLTTQGW